MLRNLIERTKVMKIVNKNMIWATFSWSRIPTKILLTKAAGFGYNRTYQYDQCTAVGSLVVVVVVVIHYLQNKVGVVDFAKAQGLVNLGFNSLMAFVKFTTPTLFWR